MKMKTKAFPTEIKADEGKRLITAYASTWEKDLGNDTIVKGAYAETIKTRFDGGKKNDIKVLWQHDPWQPIGLPVHMEEDSKGLLTVSKISKTPLGDNALRLAMDGVIDKMSIGYDTIQSKDDGEGGRILQKLELFEYSLVTFPMNTGASILDAKSSDWKAVANLAKMLLKLNKSDLAYILKQEGKALDKEKLLELLNGIVSSTQAAVDYVNADGSDDEEEAGGAGGEGQEGSDPAGDDESKAIQDLIKDIKGVKF